MKKIKGKLNWPDICLSFFRGICFLLSCLIFLSSFLANFLLHFLVSNRWNTKFYKTLSICLNIH